MLVSELDKLMSLEARGSFGFSGGFGLIAVGLAPYGFYKEPCGVYQRKKLRKGYGTSRMRFYRPTNPQTETQQNWRARLTEGWGVYFALTDEQKVLLSKQARRYRMSGPNLFMRRWLKGEI